MAMVNIDGSDGRFVVIVPASSSERRPEPAREGGIEDDIRAMAATYTQFRAF
ncbi:hypothetical protein [Pseudomonas sp. G(2018)]|uniref:hypothetical protein n=1 Tax=Pseudomonas sp. G(2018) TaxID=2502242 RepID=UPI00148524B0|nr:hypothetical protein [Pseudomonas sp. G(2018)]